MTQLHTLVQIEKMLYQYQSFILWDFLPDYHLDQYNGWLHGSSMFSYEILNSQCSMKPTILKLKRYSTSLQFACLVMNFVF